MLEESNETILQMKDAKYFSFKKLQLNMDNWLKSHIIYKKHSLKTVHAETNKTIVEVDIHCFHGWRLQESRTNDAGKFKKMILPLVGSQWWGWGGGKNALLCVNSAENKFFSI